MAPFSKTAMSVVPPPMSMESTPSSFSSGVSTASAVAICDSTVPRTLTLAFFRQSSRFLVAVSEPVMIWI